MAHDTTHFAKMMIGDLVISAAQLNAQVEALGEQVATLTKERDDLRSVADRFTKTHAFGVAATTTGTDG